MITFFMALAFCLFGVSQSFAQLIDQTQAPNTAGRGIALSLTEQIGVGQGDEFTPDSSIYIINRDPARAIRRGRQLFQRKFTIAQGQGPRTATDGIGNIDTNLALGAGLADSCALCHGQPRGSAGFGGDVVTRPDGRNAPHLFGLGIKEQLADEMTQDLRVIRDQAIVDAQTANASQTRNLKSKDISFGKITAHPDGTVDTSQVEGVDTDLRVRPFFFHGGTIAIREFVVGALNDEMGLQSPDPCLNTASSGGLCTTPAGMVLDGSVDNVSGAPASDPTDDADLDGVANEIDPALVDFMEFYLLNYFKPGRGEESRYVKHGFRLMERVGCMKCHKQNLVIDSDRRVADVETKYDSSVTGFNHLFATAKTQFVSVDDGQSLPKLVPEGNSFTVENIFTDFKRHDLGINFHEINYDGTLQTEFLTTPLWGVGSTAPYGHDGRSMNLKEVILRHGGEAQNSRDAFANLPDRGQEWIIHALNSLILFPPDNTDSNLNAGDPTTPGYPQYGHGKIDLSVLFTTPGPE